MKHRLKKITLFLPSLAGGGAEKVFVNLANESHVLLGVIKNAVK